MATKNYAMIVGGVVQNCAVVDSTDSETLAALRQQYAEVQPLPAGAGIGWMWDGKKFIAPDASTDGVEQPQPVRSITVLAFRRRFTMAEKAAIEFAAVDRADASIEQRQQSAALRASLADQAAATFIDLDDADVVAGVEALAAFGLLDAQRAAEVLTTPVGEGEI